MGYILPRAKRKIIILKLIIIIIIMYEFILRNAHCTKNKFNRIFFIYIGYAEINVRLVSPHSEHNLRIRRYSEKKLSLNKQNV